MIQLGILANPLEPKELELHEVEDLRAFLRERFGTWPDTARIYDLEGFGGLDRTLLAAGTSILTSRDVTPQDEAGVERLAQLRGPVLVAVAPADPITAIITVVAVIVAVGAALLLMPKPPDTGQTYQSPNNSLSDRTNTARPDARIPDIFGTVRSTPDLLTVPYKKFVDNLEVEIAYMCVGRGAYDLSNVKDGDTPLSHIAGAGAAFYGPFTSPASGDPPQLQIGSAIPEPVLSVIKMNEVNGQVLRPPNSNYVKGDDNIRFVAPDRIERTGSVDFTDFFAPDDVITVGGADFGSVGYYDYATQNARFYPDMHIEFETFDPTTLYRAGQTLVITNAGFTGLDGSGDPLYVDLSGTYVIDTLDGPTKIIQLVVP